MEVNMYQNKKSNISRVDILGIAWKKEKCWGCRWWIPRMLLESVQGVQEAGIGWRGWNSIDHKHQCIWVCDAIFLIYLCIQFEIKESAYQFNQRYVLIRIKTESPILLGIKWNFVCFFNPSCNIFDLTSEI